MKILLSSNKEIIKQYLKSNSNIGFIPTASELDNDRGYMEKDRKDLISMNYNIINIDISNKSKPDIINKEKYTKLADEIERKYKDYKFIKLSNEQAIIVDDINNYKVVGTD